MTIPLSRADITQAEIEEVVRVLQSGWLSQGTELVLLEEMVAQRTRRKYGIAVSSGTSALHLCLLSLGITKGDEVITTPFSFIATTNAILLAGAKPVFIDIDPETYNMKPELTEAALTEHTKAILPVEAFGNTAHFDQYERIAQNHQIPLIEDSCEAIGAYLDGRPAGSFGMCSVFGFFPNKQVTTGEGGIILTDSEDLREMCISLRNHGRDAYGRYVSLGYNYKMSEIAAALGYVQFQRLDELLLKRRQVAALYNTFLAEVEEIHLPPNPCCDHSASASWFVYVVRLSDSFNQDDRDTVIKQLHSRGIGCSPYFPPIHLQKHIQERFGFRVGDFPECERIAQRTIALPFSTQLEEKDIKLVCQNLKNCLVSTSFTPKRSVIPRKVLIEE